MAQNRTNFAEPLVTPGAGGHSVRMKRQVLLAMLVGLLCSTAVSVAPLPATAASTTRSAPARAAYTTLSAAEFERRLFNRINVRRSNHGCRQFRLNSALVLAARRHSSLMSSRRVLSHRLAGEPSLASRIENAGYTNWRMLAENLAWGQTWPRGVLRAWVGSSGHRANLDNCGLRDIGIGVVIRNGRPWVTADFGRRRT